MLPEMIHFGNLVLVLEMESSLNSKIVGDKGNLTQHVENVHQQTQYKYQICGKSFSKSGSLKYHIKTIHEGQRDHKCDSCGKSFATSGNLKKHIKTLHEGQRFKCDFCKKYFTEFTLMMFMAFMYCIDVYFHIS